MWEDSLAVHELLKHEHKWCILPDNSHYAYRQHSGSVCANFTPKRRLDTLIVLHRIMDIFQYCGYSDEQLRDYWRSGNNAYYTQGPDDCYNRLDKTGKNRFEQEVKAITRLTGVFPYDVFMWIRLNVLHGRCNVIPRILEWLYYGLRKRFFLIKKHERFQ